MNSREQLIMWDIARRGIQVRLHLDGVAGPLFHYDLRHSKQGRPNLFQRVY